MVPEMGSGLGWGTATETGSETGSVKETAMERERVRGSEKDLETGMG